MTGNRPIRGGRNTSARSTTASSISIGVSQSIRIPSRASLFIGSPATGHLFEHVFQPIPHGVDADRNVVDLAMVEAAFLALEHFQGLLPRAYGIETFLRQRQ